MIEQVNGFITPMKEWDAVGKNDGKITGTENGTKSVFQSVLEDTIQNVYDTQKDVEQKQYLLATGQLEDAHSLPIAQAKAELSLEVMISLRNKAMEAYNEIGSGKSYECCSRSWRGQLLDPSCKGRV